MSKAEVDNKHLVLKATLYDACRACGTTDRHFTQNDLLDLNIIPGRDLQTLLAIINALCREKLFVPCTDDGQPAWRWRPKEEADKYAQCDNEEQIIVYSLIDDAGRDGIWSQTIPKRLKMHENVFKNCIKHLLQKKLIATFKNVQNPTKKMFIKASLRPSEKATGGPFFTDQALDTTFVDMLKAFAYDHIKKQSTASTAKQRKNSAATGSGGIGRRTAAKVTKSQKNSTTPAVAAVVPKKRTADQMRGDTATRSDLVVMPAGYLHFPTIAEITEALTASKIVTDTVLDEAQVESLVICLMYDNLVEEVVVGDRKGWRVTRASKQSGESWMMKLQQQQQQQQTLADMEDISPTTFKNDGQDAPCFNCPVANLCDLGAPVGPHNCEYFATYLGMDAPIDQEGG